MSDSARCPPKIDPRQWQRLLDHESVESSGFIFQRTVEIAFEMSRPVLRPGQIWIDVGCGTGHLAQRLCEAGANVIGLDHDRIMLDFAQQRCSRTSSGRLPRWILGSARAVPLRDGSVDRLVATSLSSYFPTLHRFCREAHRVLRDDGYAVISFTNPSSLLLKTNHLADRFARRTTDQHEFHLHTVASVIREMEQLGFDVLQTRFYNFALHAGSWLLPSSRMARRLEGLGGTIGGLLGRNFMVVARRANR